MPIPQMESRYTNPINPPELASFRTWLQHDPHFFRLARPETRNVQRVIRVLDTRLPFANSEPDWLTHEYRMALTLRYIAETYDSEGLIFDLFGINRRTMQMYSIVAKESKATKFYADLRGGLEAIHRRRQIRQEEHARKEHAKGRQVQRKHPTTHTLAELATVDVHQT